MSARIALLIIIGVTSATFIVLCVQSVRRARVAGATGSIQPAFAELAIGAVTNFFDTLGIGSFATTTAAYKTLRLVPDENIPGTMLIGHALPVAAQAFIFIAVVNVETTTLLTLIAACVVGGWLGAGVVTKLPRRPIQIGMGIGLLLAATVMVLTQLGALPGGGTAIGLAGGKLVLAAVMSGLLGALLMIGRYNMRAALGLTLGGIPAVLIAGLIVKSLQLEVLRWVVVAVVGYAAVMMLRSAIVTRTVLPVSWRLTDLATPPSLFESTPECAGPFEAPPVRRR